MKSRSITEDKRVPFLVSLRLEYFGKVKCNLAKLREQQTYMVEICFSEVFGLSCSKISLHHGCERNLRLALYTFCQNKIIAGYPRLRHKAIVKIPDTIIIECFVLVHPYGICQEVFGAVSTDIILYRYSVKGFSDAA
ncbi:hypothetical protein T06_5398 [Trichinella sp. T6]|nr:hypothetical protein T06_5398 [Trichinella sp. T6]